MVAASPMRGSALQSSSSTTSQELHKSLVFDWGKGEIVVVAWVAAGSRLLRRGSKLCQRHFDFFFSLLVLIVSLCSSKIEF